MMKSGIERSCSRRLSETVVELHMVYLILLEPNDTLIDICLHQSPDCVSQLILVDSKSLTKQQRSQFLANKNSLMLGSCNFILFSMLVTLIPGERALFVCKPTQLDQVAGKFRPVFILLFRSLKHEIFLWICKLLERQSHCLY